MTSFHYKQFDASNRSDRQLVHFELIQTYNRPIAMLSHGPALWAQPVMGYGLFEDPDGAQSLEPLIMDYTDGHLLAISDCDYNLAWVKPLTYDKCDDEIDDEDDCTDSTDEDDDLLEAPR